MSPQHLPLLPLLYLTTSLAAFAAPAPVETGAAPGAPAPDGRVWRSDQGDGSFRNPVLFSDFADPDCIRIGTTYYAVASTFNLSPGLPLLRSGDLVNWSLVGHALPRLVPESHFGVPRRGEGVWAPSLRHHAGRFWIYYPDPDFGIYVVTAERFEGPWSEPRLVLPGRGLIDPCPLWDDDGRVWLVHGWARSRSGIGNVISLCELTADGQAAKGESRVIIDGDKLPGYRTLEGPKIYKRRGLYWIFAPAGGVPEGWQSVFRSKSIAGPYEDRIVLEQGATAVNGPHQGAWIDSPDGREWFLHFQDREAFGRIPHLQPLQWREDGWPVMGEDPDGDGRGQPVPRHSLPVRLPAAEAASAAYPASDDFSAPVLGLQWQWEANPPAGACSLTRRPGFLRLEALPAPDLWRAAHVVSQPLQGPASSTTVALDFSGARPGQRAGLALLARECTWLEVRRTAQGFELGRGHRREAPRDAAAVPETFSATVPLAGPRLWLRVLAAAGSPWQLLYSTDGQHFSPLGEPWTAKKGWWLGARIGLFALSPQDHKEAGHCDFDLFEVAPLP